MTSTLISTEAILAVHAERISAAERGIEAAHDEAKTTGEKVDALRAENAAGQTKLLYWLMGLMATAICGLLAALGSILMAYLAVAKH